MIFGVRMAAPTQIVPVAEDAAAEAPADSGQDAPADEPADAPADDEGDAPADGGGAGGGLTDGEFRGTGSKYAYGTIQVTITVEDGKVSAADATYPTGGESATINPPAIEKLNESALTAENGDDVDAVSGATLTTEAYRKSLQAALDKAAG
ncbi:hypothetical protein JCM9534A_13750 [Catenuloplanes indicus JCM 9534]